MLASPGISITALATLLDTSVEVIEAALPTVAEHLRAIGLAIARHGERLRIEPLDVPSVDANIVVGDRPMTVTEARLLRRVDRGEDVRRSLSKADRELTLPSLCRSGLVDTTSAVPAARRDLCSNPAR